MSSFVLSSPRIRGDRALEVAPGEGPVALFLDGVFYRDRIGLPDALTTSGLRAATLSSGSPLDRHTDFTCNPTYGHFIVDEVLPRLRGPVDLLVGVSLSGLAVAHLALERPDLFPRIVSQSPSAWWDDEALVKRVRGMDGVPTAAWFSVGTRETETDVFHEPTSMHQRTAQWDSVLRLAEAWGPRGTLRPFEGGHEVPPWTKELGPAVTWMMQKT